MTLNPNQVPANLVDGSTDTKWTDASFGSGSSVVELTLPNALVVKEYVFYTGADPDKRDPTGWTVERLNRGTWQTLGSLTGTPPAGRGLPYAPFNMAPLPVPSPPPPPRQPPCSPMPSPSPPPPSPPPPSPPPPSPPPIPPGQAPRPPPPGLPPPPTSPDSKTYKFAFDELYHGGNGDGVALAEVRLYGEGDELLAILGAQCEGCDPLDENELAMQAVDGNSATKWLDAAIANVGVSQLVITLEDSVTVAAYTFVTADDADSCKRDPISWSFSRVGRNGEEIEIDRIQNYAPAAACLGRNAAYGMIYTVTPPAPPLSPSPTPPTPPMA